MSDAKMMVAEQAVGQLVRADAAEVLAEEILAFAEATSDDNPRFVESSRPDFAAPPVFTARYFNPLYLKVLNGAGADFSRLVFGEMDYRYHQPITVGAKIVAEVETTELEEKESGQLLRAQARAVHAETQQLLVQGVANFFVRAPKKPGAKKSKSAPAEEGKPKEAFSVELMTREDQPRLFAEIARDPNPIHLDERIARAAGLGGVIMHGLCTMAFCGRAVVNGICEGDPTRLARLSVRFSKPARPGQPLTIRVFEGAEEANKFTFIAENEAGQPVITGGVAETR